MTIALSLAQENSTPSYSNSPSIDIFLQNLLEPTTTFRFAHSAKLVVQPNWSLGPRTVNDHLIYAIHEGGIAGKIDGHPVLMQTHDLFWMPPGSHYHFYAADSKVPTSYTYCRFNLERQTQPHRFQETFLKLTAHYNAFRLCEELLPQNQLIDSDYEQMRMKTLIGHLYCHFKDDKSDRIGGLQPHQRKVLLTYIHEHITDRFSIKDLATQVKLNPAYMSLQFKKSFGQNLQSYIKETRIKKAMELMVDQDLRVGEVSRLLGYENYFLFSRQFKEVIGLSPKQWLTRQ